MGADSKKVCHFGYTMAYVCDYISWFWMPCFKGDNCSILGDNRNPSANSLNRPDSRNRPSGVPTKLMGYFYRSSNSAIYLMPSSSIWGRVLKAMN